jgi:hypothetical protein
VECWQPKSSSGRTVFRRRPARAEPLFDFNLEALNVVPPWVWWAAGIGVLTGLVAAARALLG